MTTTRADYPDATKPHRPMHDPWMTDRGDPDYLKPHDRWCILCGRDDSDTTIHPERSENP